MKIIKVKTYLIACNQNEAVHWRSPIKNKIVKSDVYINTTVKGKPLSNFGLKLTDKKLK